jgi:hypothetical protein
MREHPAIRFLWMVPLAVILLSAGLLLYGSFSDKLIAIGCGSLVFGAMASAAFHERDIKTGFSLLALASAGAFALSIDFFDISFGRFEALRQHPITPVVSILALLVAGAYMTYKLNYLPIVFLFGAVLFPVGFFLLINRFGALAGWW